ALSVERDGLTARHPQSARTRNSLAILLHARGKSDEAERLLEEALATRRAITPDHPDVAGTLYQLAMVQKDVGKNAEAIASMEEAVSIWRRVLGNEHPY